MIIDGINILTNYSAILLYGSLAELVQYPPLKKPLSNDWAEYDGLEVDLSAPVLDKRNLKLEFLIDDIYIDSFTSFILAKTYRSYYSIELNKSYVLRCFEITGINRPQGKYGITLNLSDDFPLAGYTYVEPFLTALSTGMLFGGKNVSSYGLVALEGGGISLDSIVRMKDKLIVESKFTSGVSVAEQPSQTQSYQADLDFFIRQSVANFFVGYNAFLRDLVQPNLKLLTYYGSNYNFHYVSSKVKTLIVINGEVYCNFSVKIEVV